MSVVENDIEAPGYRNDKLFQGLVRMAPAATTAGYVIEVVGSGYLKRNVPVLFNEGQVSTVILDFG